MIASLPFAPEIVLPAARYFIDDVHLEKAESYGFKASFNPSYPVKSGSEVGWVSPWNYGLNQGPIVLMIEIIVRDSYGGSCGSVPILSPGCAELDFPVAGYDGAQRESSPLVHGRRREASARADRAVFVTDRSEGLQMASGAAEHPLAVCERNTMTQLWPG